MFWDTKQVGWKVIAFFLLADYILVTLAVLVFTTNWLDPLDSATKGLINATLVVNLVMIGLVGAGLFLKPGPLSPSNAGLKLSNLRTGFLLILGFWVLIQLLQATFSLITTGNLALSANWSTLGVTVIVGQVLAQFFGNALYEEVAYRGFLLPQLQLKFSRLKWFTHKPAGPLVVALLASQVLFALRHVAVRLYEGTNGLELVISLGFVTLLGLGFALVYLRTGNIFIVIGVHSLYNYPASLFGGSDPARVILVILTGLLLVAWPALIHHKKAGGRASLTLKPGKI